MKNGSKKFSVSLSDGLATVRDAILLILTEIVAKVGDSLVEGGLDAEVQAAIVIVVFAGFKFGWKWYTDTQRVSAI